MDRLPESPLLFEPAAAPLPTLSGARASIHPTALVAAGAEIAAGAIIGPWSQIGPNVSVAPGAEVDAHVVIDGRTAIGAGAHLFPFCTVGLAPQDMKYRGELTGCEIGPRTHVREHCTIHRGTVTGVGITRVGADCLVMAVAHVAHDCQIGNGVIIANNVVMGGHVTIGDQAVIGGSAALHQYIRIGRSAIVGGVSGVEADVIPFGAVLGNRGRLTGLNVVGLRRRGFDKATIQKLRAMFRLLFRHEGVFTARLAETRLRYGDDPLAAEVLAFIDAPSRRGLIRATLRSEGDESPG
ncbi:MAG: acyl-ACP--UDP-N-acetylglucosamine O-acyltransferase [Acetobacteraceae bacterium]